MERQNSTRGSKNSDSQKDRKQSFVVGRKTTRPGKSQSQSGGSSEKAQTTRKRSRPFVANNGLAKTSTKKKGAKKRRSDSSKRSQRSHNSGQKTGRYTSAPISPDARSTSLPPVKKGHVRILPLGGTEEVGKNMTAVETYDDLFVFDAGFQFVSEEEIPGIDYIIPNITYLEERKDKIRGLLITHGHLDHIGGIPFMIEQLGYPPIYTTNLTELLIRKRNEEFPELKKMNIIPFLANQRMKIGKSYVRAFPVTHSIPDCIAFSLETSLGNIVISGDLRLDHTAGVPSDKEKEVWGEVSKQDNLFFMCDSTNAEQTGFSTDEHTVVNNLEQHIKDAKNRLIIGTFASQFERIIKIIMIAEKYNKKIVTEGRSIKTNVEIAQRSGMLKSKSDTIIPVEAIGDYPPDRIIVLSTGAQGEEFAALMRISTGKHKHIKLNQRDTVILSSSVIPGNELSVQKLKDNLTRYGLKLINYRTSDIHTSGHGNIEELIWINKQVGAKFFMPGYGYHSMLRAHAEGVINTGFPKENVIIPDNGQLIDISPDKKITIHKEKAPADTMAVDGFRIGGVQEVVIRDRKALTRDGIFVIVATVDGRTGKMQKSPDIISRGFVYLRENQDLLRQARYVAKKTIEDNTVNVREIDYDFVKDQVTESIKKFLFQQTNKRPMVLPVILAV